MRKDTLFHPPHGMLKDNMDVMELFKHFSMCRHCSKNFMHITSLVAYDSFTCIN